MATTCSSTGEPLFHIGSDQENKADAASQDTGQFFQSVEPSPEELSNLQQSRSEGRYPTKTTKQSKEQNFVEALQDASQDIKSTWRLGH